ncbi:50S ribosomal protein L4 [Candidatus Babeliales bacterium]|nr:50S ribosomal protein L4 [Candidatus Babeliales bacterium]
MSKIDLYTMQGEKEESFEPIAIEKKEINSVAFATAIRVLRQNWRQGTVASKTRAQVNFSTRKPWRQKGTGRARAGSLRSPLWRKGGVIFGPQARTRTLSMTQAQKALAMNNVYFGMLDASSIFCVNYDVKQEVPRTKIAMDVLKKTGLNDRKVLLFMKPDDQFLYASFRNIPSIRILFFDNPNVYDLAHAHRWLFMKKDIESFNTMVARWN